MGTKKWIAVDYDAAKYLNGKLSGKLKRVTLPKVMSLQVVVELDEVLYKAISKNPSTLAKLQESAGDKARAAMDAALKKIVDAETRSQRFDEKTANIFAKDLQGALEADFQKTSQLMAKEAAKIIDDYKKGQSELSKFQVKTSGKIAMNVLLMSAGIVVSIATAGSLSPLGIIGVVRSGMGIVQDALKLASTADTIAKLIQGELKVLKKVMVEDLPKARQTQKFAAVAQGAKEIGLNLLVKATGVQIGSMKTCKEHIDIHKLNIAKLDKESKKLSEKIYAAMDEQEKLARGVDAILKKAPKEMSDKQRKALNNAKAALQKVEGVLDTMLQSTIAVNERVSKAETRQKVYEGALKAMSEGIPNWVKYVDTAAGLAADLGMGWADAANAFAKAFTVVATLEGTLGSELIDAA